mmetsp:Transcript_117986/g.280077  ORF Transcript_117986/g.280077 Transcript_117986/m.280077 type:complete len:219 (+) Transcript_117986:115-771(+)
MEAAAARSCRGTTSAGALWEVPSLAGEPTLRTLISRAAVALRSSPCGAITGTRSSGISARRKWPWWQARAPDPFDQLPFVQHFKSLGRTESTLASPVMPTCPMQCWTQSAPSASRRRSSPWIPAAVAEPWSSPVRRTTTIPRRITPGTSYFSARAKEWRYSRMGVARSACTTTARMDRARSIATGWRRRRAATAWAGHRRRPPRSVLRHSREARPLPA